MHLVKSGFGPTIRVDCLLDFLPKSLQVLRVDGKVIEHLHKGLQNNLLNAEVRTSHSPMKRYG